MRIQKNLIVIAALIASYHSRSSGNIGNETMAVADPVGDLTCCQIAVGILKRTVYQDRRIIPAFNVCDLTDGVECDVVSYPLN